MWYRNLIIKRYPFSIGSLPALYNCLCMAKKNGAKKGSYGTLESLLILKLKSLYDIEQELIKALPKLAKNATSEGLREAFESHLEETGGHAERLEQALRIMDVELKSEEVAGIRGITEDGGWVIKNVRDEAARDAALIATAQYAEHYEIAGYESACEWAHMLGLTEIEELLGKTLEEEKAASRTLTGLAEGGIDERAMGEEYQEAETPVM